MSLLARLQPRIVFCYKSTVSRPTEAVPMTKKKTVAGTKTIAASRETAEEQGAASAAGLQLKKFEEAVQLFTRRNFVEACEAFRDVAAGPASNIADKARSYLQICERRLSTPQLDFRTAEDHFNYAVERLNARDIEQAQLHFTRALGLQPDADHILYTMALCCGIGGDGNGACENLKRAIELEPKNRILARQDPEFSALAAQFPALRALLGFDAPGSL
jgi:tetratricopeptide (TPR) repeat protein